MKVLFLGAHCDDIELGCGATLNKHRNEWDVTAAVLSSSKLKIDHWQSSDRNTSALEEITFNALSMLGISDIIRKDFENCFFYKSRNEIWEFLHHLEVTIKPDLVFSQHPDTNQDHQTLYEETLRNFKKVPVLLYRQHGRDMTPFNPNTFSVVSEADVEAKLAALKMYQTVFFDRCYFEPESIIAEMRVHGLKVEQTFAEAFIGVRNYI